jgi:hypothetical protein
MVAPEQSSMPWMWAPASTTAPSPLAPTASNPKVGRRSGRPAGRRRARQGRSRCGCSRRSSRVGLAVDRADLEALVEIRTWDALFEFAHFSDDELAQAALAQRRRGHQVTVQDLAAEIHQIRTTTRKLDLIDAALRNHLDKVELADALWPVLKAKIEACIATGDFSAVPVAAAVWRAAELAREPRRNVAVRPAS